MPEQPQCSHQLAGQAAYEIDRLVGEGSFGQVWLGVHRGTREEVAIKLLPRGRKCSKYVRRELQANMRLSHPHIVRCRHLFLTEHDLALVFDYCEGGNLQQYISQRGPLPEWEARRFFQQLILAVSYMHAMGIVNRDIKTENALLCANGRLKLTDFGYAKSDSDSQPISKVGTPNYAAPEVIAPVLEGIETGYNGAAADAWSCGVFLYVCLFCRYPFERSGDPANQSGLARVLARTVACNYDFPVGHSVSADALDMIRNLLVRDPEERMTLDEIMQHPFFLTGLPPTALELNQRCIKRQIQPAELAGKEQWVCRLWEQARTVTGNEAGISTPQSSNSSLAAMIMPEYDSAHVREACEEASVMLQSSSMDE